MHYVLSLKIFFLFKYPIYIYIIYEPSYVVHIYPTQKCIILAAPLFLSLSLSFKGAHTSIHIVWFFFFYFLRCWPPGGPPTFKTPAAINFSIFAIVAVSFICFCAATGSVLISCKILFINGSRKIFCISGSAIARACLCASISPPELVFTFLTVRSKPFFASSFSGS